MGAARQELIELIGAVLTRWELAGDDSEPIAVLQPALGKLFDAIPGRAPRSDDHPMDDAFGFTGTT